MIQQSLPLIITAALMQPCVAEEAAASHELDSLLADYIKIAEDLTAILLQVDSRESATAHSQELAKIVVRLDKVRQRFEKIPPLADAEGQPIRQKYEQKMRVAWGKLYTEIFRIQKKQCFGSQPFLEQFQVFCQLLNQ